MQTNTAIGFHCVQHPTGIGDAEATGNLPVVLAVDDAGIIAEAQQKAPSAIKIFRPYVPQNDVQTGFKRTPRTKPAAYAREVFNLYEPVLSANRTILTGPNTFVQLYNEPVFKIGSGLTERGDPEGLDWLAQVTQELAVIANAAGYKLCAYNFSTGFPEIEMWSRPAFQSAYKVLLELGCIIGIHGYSTLPPTVERASTFRHEAIFKELRAHGMNGVKFVYTEWGRIDWVEHVTAEQYLSEIIAADPQLMAEPDLSGVCLFTLGKADWAKYSLEAITPQLINYLRSRPKTPAPAPAPTPTPVPTPVGTNLLVNPDLFSGPPLINGRGFHTIPGHDSTNVGNGWQFQAHEGIGPDFLDSPPLTAWGVPSAVYHAVGNGRPGAGPLPASEQTLYFNAENPVVYHLFLPYGKMWWELFQTLKNAPAGTYRFKGEIYPDIYTGAHKFDTNPNAAQYRVKASNNTPPAYTKGGTGSWNKLDRLIQHNDGDLTATLEAVAPFGVEVVGWFVRGLGLFKVEAPVPTPTPTPVIFGDGDNVVVLATLLNVRAYAWDKTTPPIVGQVKGGVLGVVVGGPVTVSDGGRWIRVVFWSETRLIYGWVNAAFLKVA